MRRRLGTLLLLVILAALFLWWLGRWPLASRPPALPGEGVGDAAPPRRAPAAGPTPTPLPVRPKYPPGTLVDYTVQPGDTLPALAAHFNTSVEAIRKANPQLPLTITTLPPGLGLRIPIYYLPTWGTPFKSIPDPLFVNGPASRDFDVDAFLETTPGWLKTVRAPFEQNIRPAAYIIEKIALNFSIDPRVLLALLDYQTGALSSSVPPENLETFLGFDPSRYRGFALQIAHMADLLSQGYYGWRQGTLRFFTLKDGSLVYPDPWQNAGSVALQYYLAQVLPAEAYPQAVGPEGVFRVYVHWFGDPWNPPPPPHIPGDLRQPPLNFPFPRGESWSYSGGPHPAWGRLGAWAAVDFAPPGVRGCKVSHRWAVAEAPGVVARSERSILVLDLDGDGDERTGWVLFHMHLVDRPPVGAVLQARQPIGRPSCKGGFATGANIHMGRKYNGEWIPAWGLIPFDFEGWVAVQGSRPYDGYLRYRQQWVVACPCGNAASLVTSWKEMYGRAQVPAVNPAPEGPNPLP